MNNITAVTVNFKTPDLVATCIESFHAHYPDIRHIVLDNGGCPMSLEVLREWRNNEYIDLIESQRNLGHGHALNVAIALVETDYVFLLDSDTRTDKGGFLEKMLALFEDDNLFACGWLRSVDPETGVPHRHQQLDGLPYVHPYACLMDIIKFREGRGFSKRGAPAVEPMADAKANGYVVKSFPVEDYIWHKVGGTRGMFGGKVRIRTDAEPREWKLYKI